jgi:hypothetical protein
MQALLQREPETSTLVFSRERRKSVVPAKSLIHSDRRCADEITRSADLLMSLAKVHDLSVHEMRFKWRKKLRIKHAPRKGRLYQRKFIK